MDDDRQIEVEAPAQITVRDSQSEAEVTSFPDDGMLMERPGRSRQDSTIDALRRIEDGLSSIRWLLMGIFTLTAASLVISVLVIVFAIIQARGH